MLSTWNKRTGVVYLSHLPTQLPTSIHPSIPIHPSIHSFIHPTIHPFISRSIHTSIHMSIDPSLSVSVYVMQIEHFKTGDPTIGIAAALHWLIDQGAHGLGRIIRALAHRAVRRLLRGRNHDRSRSRCVLGCLGGQASTWRDLVGGRKTWESNRKSAARQKVRSYLSSCLRIHVGPGRSGFVSWISASQETGASADPSDLSPMIQNVFFTSPSLPLWVLLANMASRSGLAKSSSLVLRCFSLDFTRKYGRYGDPNVHFGDGR